MPRADEWERTQRGASTRAFLERRVLQIWPAYLVAALVRTFIVTLLVGGDPFTRERAVFAEMLLLLGPVNSPGQLTGLPIPVLNGSMWDNIAQVPPLTSPWQLLASWAC